MQNKIDFFKTLEKNRDKVEWLLSTFKGSRDNDNKLISYFWFYEASAGVNKYNTIKTGMSALEFLSDFSNGRFTNPETIRRSRQKIQEDNPDLRGKNYKKRKLAAIDMKNKINKL